MTVRPAVVLARLAHLGEVMVQLQRLRALSADERTDPLRQLAAERALHVAIEAVLDVGHHLLAGRGHPIPATYREVVPALVAHGILATELGARLEGMAGMRNILVHDYVHVDPTQVWAVVDQKLGDLEDVHAAFAALPELGRRA
jgi:uncharacterized protein YutE (UPF0331/DUF86 family)